MKMLFFSVFDAAVHAYLPPFSSRTKMEAIRSFKDAVQDTNHQFFKHYTDYSMFLVGEFDDADGLFKSPVAPERIISATELVDDQVFPPSKQVS